MKIHEDVYPWMYKYDRTNSLWRAFHKDGTEVNQHNKLELLFVMGKYNDKLKGYPTEWDLLYATYRLPKLTIEGRQLFLLNEVSVS